MTGGDSDQGFAADGVGHELQVGIDLRQRCAHAAAPGQERQRLRSGLQTGGEDAFFAFPHLDLALFDGLPEGGGHRHAESAARVIAHRFADTVAGDEQVERQAAVDDREIGDAAPDELPQKSHRGWRTDGNRHAAFHPSRGVGLIENALLSFHWLHTCSHRFEKENKRSGRPPYQR